LTEQTAWQGVRDILAQVQAAGADWRQVEEAWPQIRQGWEQLTLVPPAEEVSSDDGWDWHTESQAISASTPSATVDSEREALILAYAQTIGPYLERRGLRQEALAWYERALTAAHTLGQRPEEGYLLIKVGRFADGPRATEAIQTALALFRELGDKAGEATALYHHGLRYYHAARPVDARRTLEQALRIQQEIGDRAGEGQTRYGLALLEGQGRQTTAKQRRRLELLEQALTLQQEAADRMGVAQTLDNLGIVHQRLGQAAEALANLEQALALRRELGDRPGEAQTLTNLATLLGAVGETDQALAYYEQALPIWPQLERDDMVGMTYYAMGRLCLLAQQLDRATTYFEQARAQGEKMKSRELSDAAAMALRMVRRQESEAQLKNMGRQGWHWLLEKMGLRRRT